MIVGMSNYLHCLTQVPKERDILVEKEFNKLLEATAFLSHELEVGEIDGEPLSLGKSFELIIQYVLVY